ncbi:serine protease SP24D-like [Trichogramma pretiosum]|uniref:serine protease SP24D-like n=1 Tax=Trichogramma pretiosum TaxID=7493 RepID=UPI0006C9BB9E|nr:serine protease SP24D-like [Trichogramma pretiosum]
MKAYAHLLAIFFLLWGSGGGEARAIQDPNRIINGRGMANYGEFPYYAMLLSRQGWGFGSFCGGSLITVRHVLTAAHCVYQNSPDNFLVELGSVQVGQGIRHYVSRVAWHRNYFFDYIAHDDIGMVHLKTDVTFSSVIQPIALPPAGANFAAGSRVIVTGYGATYPGGPAVNEVNVLYTETMARDNCRNHYDNYNVRGFCTYTPQESACGVSI